MYFYPFLQILLADDENPDEEPTGDIVEGSEQNKPEAKPEIISWRTRKPEDDSAAQRPPSPSRKRYSPDRSNNRRRPNGSYLMFCVLVLNHQIKSMDYA